MPRGRAARGSAAVVEFQASACQCVVAAGGHGTLVVVGNVVHHPVAAGHQRALALPIALLVLGQDRQLALRGVATSSCPRRHLRHLRILLVRSYANSVAADLTDRRYGHPHGFPLALDLGHYWAVARLTHGPEGDAGAGFVARTVPGDGPSNQARRSGGVSRRLAGRAERCSTLRRLPGGVPRCPGDQAASDPRSGTAVGVVGVGCGGADGTGRHRVRRSCA